MPVRDFTLLIPSYNRPRLLRALLYFLRSTTPGLKFLVLDSSEDKAPVQEIVSENHIIAYPSEAHPFDKFLDGVNRVETKYCMLLGDDDVVLLDGVTACMEALEAQPNASCARGNAFSYTWNPSEPDMMHVADGCVVPPAIEEATALERVATLMNHFHSTIYAVHRPQTLKWFLETSAKQETLLGREMLTCCMSAVAGPILSVDKIVHGRSMGRPVFPYRSWHPLETFVNDAALLGSEYAQYRQRLAFAIHPKSGMLMDEVLRAIDVIHLRYLVRHAPLDVLDFLVERKSKGLRPEGHMTPELQKSLLNASLSHNTVGLGNDRMAAIFDRLGPYMWGLNPQSDSRQAAREARGAVGEAWASLGSPSP